MTYRPDAKSRYRSTRFFEYLGTVDIVIGHFQNKTHIIKIYVYVWFQRDFLSWDNLKQIYKTNTLSSTNALYSNGAFD